MGKGPIWSTGKRCNLSSYVTLAAVNFTYKILSCCNCGPPYQNIGNSIMNAQQFCEFGEGEIRCVGGGRGQSDKVVCINYIMVRKHIFEISLGIWTL